MKLQTHRYLHFRFSGYPHICENPFDIAGSDYRPTLHSLSRDSFFVSLGPSLSTVGNTMKSVHEAF